jgi:putative membrane protein
VSVQQRSRPGSKVELIPHGRYLAVLGIAFAAWFGALALDVVDRPTWLLENLLVFVLVPLLGLTYRRFPFSRLSYSLIFVFLCVHEVGAHYTYSEVPYDEWFAQLSGRSFEELLGWERNHFDRAVHFAYVLLLAYPVREIFLRIADVRGFWGYFLPLDLTMSSSMVYELIEWAVADLFGGELGMAYLGTQGDVWDAHKDMALASLGAAIAMGVTALVNWRTQRDFAREFGESLRVKHAQPLGEEALARRARE